MSLANFFIVVLLFPGKIRITFFFDLHTVFQSNSLKLMAFFGWKRESFEAKYCYHPTIEIVIINFWNFKFRFFLKDFNNKLKIFFFSDGRKYSSIVFEHIFVCFNFFLVKISSCISGLALNYIHRVQSSGRAVFVLELVVSGFEASQKNCQTWSFM